MLITDMTLYWHLQSTSKIADRMLISKRPPNDVSCTHFGCIYIFARDLQGLASFREKHMPLLIITWGELHPDIFSWQAKSDMCRLVSRSIPPASARRRDIEA